MKKIILILTAILFCAITFAQSVPQGIYFLEIETNDGIINNKLILQL